MLTLDSTKRIDGIYYLSAKSSSNFDEDSYIRIRKKEGRLYSDSIVKKLPFIDSDHPLKDEWIVREKTYERVSKYISKQSIKMVLEVGCGNGWLTNAISKKCGCIGAGIDLNEIELRQGARIFGNNEKAIFIYGNIFEDILPSGLFDIIIFAASIQYFGNLSEVIPASLRFLRPGGEIHIIDSHFYDENEIINAKGRTIHYYEELGFPDMAYKYFHHSWNELNHFSYRIMKVRNNKFAKLYFSF